MTQINEFDSSLNDGISLRQDLAQYLIANRCASLDVRVIFLVALRADPVTGTVTFEDGELSSLIGLKTRGDAFTPTEIASSLRRLKREGVVTESARDFTSITLNPDIVQGYRDNRPEGSFAENMGYVTTWNEEVA